MLWHVHQLNLALQMLDITNEGYGNDFINYLRAHMYIASMAQLKLAAPEDAVAVTVTGYVDLGVDFDYDNNGKPIGTSVLVHISQVQQKKDGEGSKQDMQPGPDSCTHVRPRLMHIGHQS